jgi:hypothetical protein
MPVLTRTQVSRIGVLRVVDLANTGAAARHAATTRRASAEPDYDDRNVAEGLARRVSA